MECLSTHSFIVFLVGRLERWLLATVDPDEVEACPKAICLSVTDGLYTDRQSRQEIASSRDRSADVLLCLLVYAARRTRYRLRRLLNELMQVPLALPWPCSRKAVSVTNAVDW